MGAADPLPLPHGMPRIRTANPPKGGGYACACFVRYRNKMLAEGWFL